jgi:ornithine cyclodeaminase/alanine dehydrogenase-like protein (mu-crystallin family)
VNHHSEVPMELYASASVLIESNVGLETELKGLRQHVNGEIGEFIIGRKHSSGTGRTVFQSMGNAIEDAIMGNLIYQKLIKL